MKLTPIAQGTGVPANSSESAPNSEKILRAKALAAGEAPQDPKPSGDPQVDKIKAKQTIKMRTQVSTNRHEELPSPGVESAPKNEVDNQTDTQIPNPDVNEPQEPVVEATKPLDPQFAALAKAKRALQVKERELAQREDALKNTQPSADLIARLKTNPLSVLTEAGVSYDQLTEAILNNPSGSNTEILQLRSDIKALKDELTGQLTQRDQDAEKQVLSEMKREADRITAQGEEYEAIRQAKAQQHVVNLIHRTWQKTGEILDVREAANLVEEKLIDDAIPFAKIKKVQAKLTPQQEQAIVQAVQGEATTPSAKLQTKVMRTLTNRDAATPGDMNRRARAIAAFNGTYKR